jgi:hypothetical protein
VTCYFDKSWPREGKGKKTETIGENATSSDVNTKRVAKSLTENIDLPLP